MPPCIGLHLPLTTCGELTHTHAHKSFHPQHKVHSGTKKWVYHAMHLVDLCVIKLDNSSSEVLLQSGTMHLAILTKSAKNN